MSYSVLFICFIFLRSCLMIHTHHKLFMHHFRTYCMDEINLECLRIVQSSCLGCSFCRYKHKVQIFGLYMYVYILLPAQRLSILGNYAQVSEDVTRVKLGVTEHCRLQYYNFNEFYDLRKGHCFQAVCRGMSEDLMLRTQHNILKVTPRPQCDIP